MTLKSVADQIMCELDNLDYTTQLLEETTPNKIVFGVKDEDGKYIVTVTPA